MITDTVENVNSATNGKDKLDIKELTRAAIGEQDDGQVPRFQLFGAGHYLKEPPPLTWTIKELLVDGAFMVVVGESGSGKTYAMMDLATCVALGKPWLGRETRQGKVIIIDEENGPSRMHRRMHSVVKGHLGDENTPLFYTTFNGLNLTDDKEAENLRALITEQKPVLVVIDSLVDIVPGVEENSANEMHKPLHQLHKIAAETGTAIILIHHTGKDGKYRGSSTIKADVDGMLVAAREEGTDTLNFRFEKLRDGNQSPFQAEMVWFEGLFWLKEKELDKVYTIGEKYILNRLAEGETSRAEMRNKRSAAISKNKFNKSFSRLIENELIVRTNPDKKGVEAVYRLTEAGLEAQQNL